MTLRPRARTLRTGYILCSGVHVPLRGIEETREYIDRHFFDLCTIYLHSTCLGSIFRVGLARREPFVCAQLKL